MCNNDCVDVDHIVRTVRLSLYLSRFPFTCVQIAQQPKVAVGESVSILFLQTLAIDWIDGGEVAAVHRRPSLCLSQNQRHQL